MPQCKEKRKRKTQLREKKEEYSCKDQEKRLCSELSCILGEVLGEGRVNYVQLRNVLSPRSRILEL